MPKLPRMFNGSSEQMSVAEILIENLRMGMQLKALRAQIAREAETNKMAQFTIAVALRQIAKEFGDAEANRAITDFKLERLGWNCKVCDHCGHWPCGCGG